MFGNGLEVATLMRASPAVGEGLIYRQLTALRAVTLGFYGAHSLVLLLAYLLSFSLKG